MEKPDLRVSSILSALLMAAAVLIGATFGANQLLSSELYSKSRLISMIFSQDSVGIADIAGNKRNADMLLKFVGGLTSAYINFELIPVNEVGTFTAVFESAQTGVTIDKFEYHRKNLTISGVADTLTDYGVFLARLRDTEYFESVAGHYYTATDDTIRFALECVSQSTGAYLDFG